MTHIAIGSPVPDFEADATDGTRFKLSANQGKKIIIYFYPKDSTPGCTREGKDFRDNIAQFNHFNTLILGVSRDNMKAHQRFKEKHNFSFNLLTDEKEILCQLFAVLKMKNMFGRQIRGIERSTFLIDENGVLMAEWRKVHVKTHIKEVLQKLSEIC